MHIVSTGKRLRIARVRGVSIICQAGVVFEAMAVFRSLLNIEIGCRLLRTQIEKT